MKKTIILLALMTAMTAMAQHEQRIVAAGENAIVYYMPKTEIAITIHYMEETYVAGPYAAYAEEMLGLKDVLPHDTVIRHFASVETGTRTTADLDRVCKILPEKGMDYQRVCINSKGLLAGYGITTPLNVRSTDKREQGSQINVRSTNKREHGSQINAPAALGEDALSAETEEDRAMAIVEQILMLREDRLRLLSGNLRNMPTDGKGIDRMLSEIDKQEKALVALFAGRHTFLPKQETICYCPEMTTEVMLGELRLVVETMPQFTKADTPDKKKQKTPASQICYNLPGKAHYMLFRGDELLAERIIEVAQLGVSVPLDRDLFVRGNQTEVRISTKTGNIESIVK